MDFLKLAKTRYSCRKFSDKPVEDKKINKILEAGRVSPTACNNQPQHIYILKSKEALEKLQKCKTRCFNETLAFIICYDKNTCWLREYDNEKSGVVDASIITTSMMYEAHNLGIESTWVMHFMPKAIVDEFNLPDNEIPVSVLVMGYPAKEGKPSKLHDNRKPLEETITIL